MADEDILQTLMDIKKLLVLNLLKKGLTTAEIGKALGVSYKTVERLVPRPSSHKRR